MDVFVGLKKLCSSVGRAQRFFASVEPAVLRFSRTLLLLLAPPKMNPLDGSWNVYVICVIGEVLQV